jgi:hypothetical protein
MFKILSSIKNSGQISLLCVYILAISLRVDAIVVFSNRSNCPGATAILEIGHVLQRVDLTKVVVLGPMTCINRPCIQINLWQAVQFSRALRIIFVEVFIHLLFHFLFDVRVLVNIGKRVRDWVVHGGLRLQITHSVCELVCPSIHNVHNWLVLRILFAHHILEVSVLLPCNRVNTAKLTLWELVRGMVQCLKLLRIVAYRDRLTRPVFLEGSHAQIITVLPTSPRSNYLFISSMTFILFTVHRRKKHLFSINFGAQCSSSCPIVNINVISGVIAKLLYSPFKW